MYDSLKKVSGVKEISSQRSLTKEQKRSLYRDPRTLEAEAETNYLECEFERTCNCFENALEDECFFSDRRGELIHPAHCPLSWAKSFQALPSTDSSVPPGFSSLDEYVNHLFAYERYYDKCFYAVVLGKKSLTKTLKFRTFTIIKNSRIIYVTVKLD